MGVTLYKAGDTHTVRGVKCRLCTFDEQSFEQHLEMGWFFTPEECYPEKEIEVKEHVKKKSFRNANLQSKGL